MRRILILFVLLVMLVPVGPACSSWTNYRGVSLGNGVVLRQKPLSYNKMNRDQRAAYRRRQNKYHTTRDAHDPQWWQDTQIREGEDIYSCERRRLQKLDRDLKMAPIAAYRHSEEYATRYEQWNKLEKVKGYHTEEGWYFNDNNIMRFWVWNPAKMTYESWSWEKINVMSAKENIVVRTFNPFLGFDYLPGQGYPYGDGAVFEVFVKEHPNYAFQYHKSLSEVTDFAEWKSSLTNTTYHTQWAADQVDHWSPDHKIRLMTHDATLYMQHVMPKLKKKSSETAGRRRP